MTLIVTTLTEVHRILLNFKKKNIRNPPISVQNDLARLFTEGGSTSSIREVPVCQGLPRMPPGSCRLMPWEDLYPCALGPTSLLKKWVKQEEKDKKIKVKACSLQVTWRTSYPIASWKCPRMMLTVLLSVAAFPASSRISAAKYSITAEARAASEEVKT